MVEAQTTPIQPRKVMEWDPITMEITECTAATVMKRMVFRRGHPPKQDQQRLYIYIYIFKKHQVGWDMSRYVLSLTPYRERHLSGCHCHWCLDKNAGYEDYSYGNGGYDDYGLILRGDLKDFLKQVCSRVCLPWNTCFFLGCKLKRIIFLRHGMNVRTLPFLQGPFLDHWGNFLGKKGSETLSQIADGLC